MNQALILTAVFELLDFAIRQTENRQGDHEKYIALRTQLRKELVAEANESVSPSTETTNATETDQLQS